MRVKEPVTQEVNASGCYREHLKVLFNSEVQPSFQIVGNFRKKGMEVQFILMQDYQVIGISKIKTDPFDFFQPVVKKGQVEIGKILAEVVPDRQAISGIDDLVEQP